MMNIEKLWQPYQNVFDGCRKERKFVSPINRTESFGGFTIIYDQRRYDGKNHPYCPFDKPEEKETYLPYRSLYYGINTKPVEEKHVIIFPPEHRERLEPKDINDMMHFTEETPYTISVNLKHSGASLAEHVHGQGVYEHFPIFDARSKLIWQNEHMTVSVPIFPSYCVALKAHSLYGRERLQSITEIKMPHNLVIKGSTIFLFPRDGIFSTELEIDNCKPLKVGGPEMAGLFYSKNIKQYESWTYEKIEKALSEVSLKTETEKKEFESCINEILNKQEE